MWAMGGNKRTGGENEVLGRCGFVQFAVKKASSLGLGRRHVGLCGVDWIYDPSDVHLWGFDVSIRVFWSNLQHKKKLRLKFKNVEEEEFKSVKIWAGVNC